MNLLKQKIIKKYQERVNRWRATTNRKRKIPEDENFRREEFEYDLRETDPSNEISTNNFYDEEMKDDLITPEMLLVHFYDFPNYPERE